MKGPTDSDEALVEGCLNRDPVSWSSLIRKYSNLIVVSIGNRLAKYGFNLPVEDLEDIRQNVLESLWKDGKLKSVRNRRNISYWLSIVAGNEAIEYMRKKRRIDEPPGISPLKKIDIDCVEELVESGRPSPAEEIDSKNIAKRIDREIDALPSKEKLVIKLNILYGKKHEEIARILNMPAGTVSSYIKRAKDRLRKNLKYLQ